MLDERGHAFVNPLVFDRVIVLQHKNELLRDVRKLVDQRRESLLNEVDAGRAQHRQRSLADPGQHGPERLDDVHPEPRGIVVIGLQPEPGQRALFSYRRHPLHHEHRLSAASGTVDQRKRLRQTLGECRDQAFADYEARKSGYDQLRPQERSTQVIARDRHRVKVFRAKGLAAARSSAASGTQSLEIRMLIQTSPLRVKVRGRGWMDEFCGSAWSNGSTAPGCVEAAWGGIADERTVVAMTLPGESAEYRAARDRLLEREIELRRAMEAVAAARRGLPPGGPVKLGYVFQGAGANGTPTDVRLSELFDRGKDSLVIYSFMFPRDPRDHTPGPRDGETGLLPLAEGPCPSCAAFLDQLDGVAEHASQHVNLAVVAKAPLTRVLAFARERGWRRLRVLSSAGNSYNADYFAETPDGVQRPMLTVFHRDYDTIRHFWSSELLNAPSDPGQEPRHVGTLEPLWNLFDLTPEGRPMDWVEQFSYA